MITEMCEKLGFPSEATEYLQECFEKMIGTAGVTRDLSDAMQMLFDLPSGDAYTEILQRISQRSGVHRYSVDMVFYVMSAIPLRYRYLNAGYTEEQFWANMVDLRYKLIECKNLHGVWGTVTSWFTYFYRLKRFKLGRLQYEKKEYAEAAYRGILKAGDTVINCHIPSCGPLTPALVIDSLKQAYAFYKDERRDGLLPVVCSSWLLYPPHGELFAEGSNLRAFYEMFDVIRQREKPENNDFWRVFNQPYNPATLTDAPEDNSLRRAFKAFLLAGNSMGSGYGVLLFDGEKIVRA